MYVKNPLAMMTPEFVAGPELPRDSIIIEIDVEKHDIRPRAKIDEFDGSFRRWNETIRSGNNSVWWKPTDDILRGRFEIERQGEGYPRDVTGPLSNLPIPGCAIAITRDRGWLVNLLSYDRPLWEKLRRIAIGLPELPFLLLAPGITTGEGPEVPFKQVEFNSPDIFWGWCYYARKLVDLGCKLEGVRMCRPIQNVDRLPTMREIAESRKAWLFNSKAMNQEMAREGEARGQVLEGGPAQYSFDGHLTPELAGLAPADYQTVVPRKF